MTTKMLQNISMIFEHIDYRKSLEEAEDTEETDGQEESPTDEKETALPEEKDPDVSTEEQPEESGAAPEENEKNSESVSPEGSEEA